MLSNRLENETCEINLKLISIEEKVATLEKDEEKCLIPKRFLPKGIKTGDDVVLRISSEWASGLFHEEDAKKILNEILKTDE